VTINPEIIAKEILELASEQRLKILLNLLQEKTRISAMAKKLDATNPEVFRNFERLSKVGLIKKDNGGSYQITPYGKTACLVLHTISFFSNNKKYLSNHNLGDLPEKFIHRLGGTTRV